MNFTELRAILVLKLVENTIFDALQFQTDCNTFTTCGGMGVRNSENPTKKNMVKEVRISAMEHIT